MQGIADGLTDGTGNNAESRQHKVSTDDPQGRNTNG